MATLSQLGAKYAADLRRAKSNVQKSFRDGNIRTAAATVPSEFRAAVESTLQAVDGLVHSETQQSVDEATKNQVLGEIDNALSLRPRTMYMIKKGSIESMLAYQQALLDLYLQIEFV